MHQGPSLTIGIGRLTPSGVEQCRIDYRRLNSQKASSYATGVSQVPTMRVRFESNEKAPQTGKTNPDPFL